MSGLTLDQRLAVTEFLKKHFEKLRKDDLNPEASADMVVGERHAAKFGGRVAAWVSMPSPATRVTDKAQLLAWCRKNLPEAVETIEVERVRPETERALLEMVKQHSGWVNGDGEVVPVAGIGTSDASPRVELQGDAEAVIAAAWRAGEIDLGGLLALPVSGPSQDGAAS